MNKTVNINLAGTFFHIDEDAFAKLTRYLDAIKRSFSDPQGQEEIIRDIEARIAELFSEKIESTSQVISLKELDEVIAVMGQPEDYIIDEEIFEDTPETEKKKRRSQSSYKQLFRDVDNKFIAGVSSGLGHYLGIDAIWIRLLWIFFVLIGWGSPILIYILLWILVPAAETTSDKLKMTRKPINISNIEKKFKEGYDNVADKVKDADYDKYKQNAKKGASGFFNVLGSILLTIFKIFVKFFGILLIIIALSTLISLVVGLFTTGTMGVVWGDTELMDYITLVDTTNTPLWLLSIVTLFALGIPFFVLFIIGLKLLINNLKSIGWPAKIILFIVWIFSIVAIGILGLRAATEQAYSGEQVSENILPVRAGDTLQLKMNSENPYSFYTKRSGNFKIAYNDNDEKLLYSNDVRLIVRSTTDSIGKIHVEKKAEGSSFASAKERAEAIDYNYSIENNALILDGYLTTGIDNKYREQEVEVVVYLPEGSILIADENTYSFHRNYARFDDILMNGDEGHYLRILKDKTECLDCPVKVIDLNVETIKKGDWEEEVKRKFRNEDDIDRVIIDEDGLDINFTDEKDTIKIKLNNQKN
jgi:phage shock protein PspC (stress-responsive transcriptional regulator)